MDKSGLNTATVGVCQRVLYRVTHTSTAKFKVVVAGDRDVQMLCLGLAL